MIGLLSVIVAAVVGAVLHRIRGGGLQFIPRFGLGRSLWLVTPIVGLIAWPFVGVVNAVIIAALYLAGSVNGWGSYFDCGGRTDGWRDDPEVWWIDKLLLKWFGPEWAADPGAVAPDRFDVVYNGGEVRPLSWRRKRDCTGMALRGLHYLPMFLVLPAMASSLLAAVPGVIAIALFAPSYLAGRTIERWADRRGDRIEVSEYVVGAVFGAALAAQYLVVI